VLGDGLGEHPSGMFQGAVPVAAVAGQGLAQAQFRVQRAGRVVAGQVQAGALAAQFAEVGRVLLALQDAG